MGEAELLVLSPEDAVLLVDGRLPRMPVTEIFDAARRFRLPLAVVRTLRRVGDDRVVLLECLEMAAPVEGEWVGASRAGQLDRACASALRWSQEVEPGGDGPAWMRPGWMAATLGWAASVLAGSDRGRLLDFEQLKHWSLSAVVRIEGEGGDLVVKQVPPALAAEGAVTQLLSGLAPGHVPEVLAVDGERFAMAAFEAEQASVEPSGLLALGALQRSAVTHVDALVSAGCREQRAESIAGDVAALLAREDLLFERVWELSSTDERLPPRPLDARDVTQLHALCDQIDGDAARLTITAPATVVHGDFHPLNVSSVAGEPVIVDWATAFIGDPRFDLLGWQHLAHTNEGVETFLGWWSSSTAHWAAFSYLAYLANALTCAVLADAVQDETARRKWSAAVQKRLIQALGSVRT